MKLRTFEGEPIRGEWIELHCERGYNGMSHDLRGSSFAFLKDAIRVLGLSKKGAECWRRAKRRPRKGIDLLETILHPADEFEVPTSSPPFCG